jgi:hypothetical protein
MVSMRAMECLVTIVEQGSLTQPTAGPRCPGQTCIPFGGDEPLT